MYCPGCGTENELNQNYCRRCREDLRLVVKAFKKTFPLKLAAAIDAMLDSKSERFRRNSFLMFVTAAVSTVAFGWEFYSGGRLEVPIIMALLGYTSGVWEYLAYKHCIELCEQLDDSDSIGEFTTGSLTSLQLSTGNQPEGTAIFCPHCSARSLSDQTFCQSCGINLQSVRMALLGQPKKSGFKRALDRYVRKRSTDQKVGTAAATCLLVGLLYSLFAGKHHSPVYAAISIMYIFMGVWDLLVYRRSSKAEKETLQKLTSKQATTNELDHGIGYRPPLGAGNDTQPVNITGELTRELSPPIKRS